MQHEKKKKEKLFTGWCQNSHHHHNTRYSSTTSASFPDQLSRDKTVFQSNVIMVRFFPTNSRQQPKQQSPTFKMLKPFGLTKKQSIDLFFLINVQIIFL